MARRAVVQGRQEDPFIEIDRGTGDGQRTQQPEHAGAPADLRGTCRTTLDVGGQAGGIGRPELIEQERIDERSSPSTVQRVANVRVRHITYMT
jgi:hypothetical protein